MDRGRQTDKESRCRQRGVGLWADRNKCLSNLLFSWLVSQVDFPSSSSSTSCEVLFSTPAPADFCPQYEFSKLDAISQIQLQDVLHKKAVFWSGCHFLSLTHTLTSSHSSRLCVWVCSGWRWKTAAYSGRRGPSARPKVQRCPWCWLAPPAGSGPAFPTFTPCWSSGCV